MAFFGCATGPAALMSWRFPHRVTCGNLSCQRLQTGNEAERKAKVVKRGGKIGSRKKDEGM